ncbi:MAG: RNA methyltransferase [Planctomycetota bacterium]|nr:RNA methyltransferase [Planctomycetota bacterium]
MHSSTDLIESRQNPALKRVRGIAAGKEKGTLLLEGSRLVTDAIGAKATLEIILLDERTDPHALLEAGANPEIMRWVKAGLLDGTGGVLSTPGVIALGAPPPEIELSSLQPGPQDLLLVACGISDPGNLGALARAAEAAGARALVQVAGGVSPWNVRALRGSMGSLLRLPVVCGAEAGEVAQALTAQGWKSVAAATREGQPLGEFDWSGPRALWVSGETSGDPECFAEFDQVTIPMAGQVESLNVTVAGALLLFAAGRVGGS